LPLKLLWAAIISTTIVIVLGIGLILPFFFGVLHEEATQKIMLSFSILDFGNVTEYCNELSSILEKWNIKATVFFVGKVAEQNPEAVRVFNNNTDVGSQTYSYVDVTLIADYTLQLEEISKGKTAVDDAGNLGSRLFKAPYGATDENIYSLLSRSDILADFSYDNQYNVFYNGQFIKFPATVYDGFEEPAEFFLSLPNTKAPLIITFDNTQPLADVNTLVSTLKSGNFAFCKASEIVGFNLTLRGDVTG
jgi:peptidoglycan/xylan/chitin deacetylase (PgdA/CDA1 family)